jgi:hypothetical protein
MIQESCTHPEMDENCQCQRCGAQFTEVWHEIGAVRYVPVFISVLIAVLFGWFVTGRSGLADSSLGFLLMLFIFAYFLLRAARGVLDLFTTPRTYWGKVTRVRRQSLLNPFATKDATAYIGDRKFNLNFEAARLLDEDEPVLVNYLRWTNAAVAIYKPTRG